MSFWQLHIQPVIHADPEWQALVLRIARLERELADARTARINRESEIAARLTYPSAED